MILRKQIQLDRFKKEINKVWSLSVIEDEVLDSFLNLFLAGENNKIKQIEHLLNDETEELLKFLDEQDIKDYSVNFLDMIDEDDVEECKSLEDYDDEDLLDECDSRDLRWDEDRNRYNIVTTMQLEEMTKLFLSADSSKREEIINKLK